MKMSFSIPTPLSYFTSLVMSDAEFPLLETAISLAQDEYPDLDVQQVLSQVDHLLARVKRRIPADAGPLQKLRSLNQFFYRDLGFGGNVNDYYDPDNSFISVVLINRRAIPISLAVVWMELAQGLGLSARGVGFPGHFMMKVNLPEGQVVMDPLDGQSLSRENLAERLDPYRRRSGLAGEFDAPVGLYLQETRPRDIIARMLRNLKDIYSNQEDWLRLIAVQNRLLILLPQSWSDYRDRGLAYAQVGDLTLALADLDTYLQQVDNAVDLQAIAMRVEELRRATN
jgi:regulator of sirC expression with transglutaminase-like and TPR domain